MATVLVTGGSGFIGTAVVAELTREGRHVEIAGTGSADPLNGDRLATAITAETELIVHCAGSSSVGATVEDPAREHAKTVGSFRAVLAHARDARVVFISSAAVYGEIKIVPTPEHGVEPRPVSPYGKDKLECEELLRASGRAGVIVRLFSVYGEGLRKQLLWDACQKAKAATATFGGTGDEERDWLHVSDAAALIALAARHASKDVPVINGGTGRGTRVRTIVEHVAHAFGVQPVFTGHARAGDPSRYIAEITRARSLGWVPKIELEAGIARYIEWFRSL
jgi:UDP-glucose 4-epimerase